MASGRCLIEKIRLLTESHNLFYKKCVEDSMENLNVKSWTVTPYHTCCIPADGALQFPAGLGWVGGPTIETYK